MKSNRCKCENAIHSSRLAQGRQNDSAHQVRAVTAGRYRSIFVGPVCDHCARTCQRGSVERV